MLTVHFSTPTPAYMLHVICVGVCTSLIICVLTVRFSTPHPCVHVTCYLCVGVFTSLSICVLTVRFSTPHPCVHVTCTCVPVCYLCVSLYVYIFLTLSSYLPMLIQVLNKSTKQIEEITLGNVEELLGASSEVHSNDLDMLDMILC